VKGRQPSMNKILQPILFHSFARSAGCAAMAFLFADVELRKGDDAQHLQNLDCPW